MSRPRATKGLGYELQQAILTLLGDVDESEDLGSTQIIDAVITQHRALRSQVVAAIRQLCLQGRISRRGMPPHHCRYSLNPANPIDDQPRVDAGCSRPYIAPAVVGGPLVWSLGLKPAQLQSERRLA